MTLPPDAITSATDVAARLRSIVDEHNAVQIATLGGAWSPWILGAYMARATGELSQEIVKLAGEARHPELDLVFMVERHGKTFANLQADTRVALSISHNDATRDFAQAAARAILLPEHFEAVVMAALKQKMPWYQLYTPCVPVALAVSDVFITSFPLGWMPAKRLQVR